MTKQAQKLKKSKKPTCSHDNFFKLIFFDPELMKELLKLVLTKVEEKVFNLDKIKFEKDSHKKQLADIVLSFPLKAYPNQRVEFFMILEHKSYNDKDFYGQMFKYLYLLREYIIRQTGREKPIIPALFSHAKQPLKIEKNLFKKKFLKIFLLKFLLK